MAKWGEGDPRWIVEERADAHNVNNWHWRESDATQWSKTRFRSKFAESVNVNHFNIDNFTLKTILVFDLNF